jgi:hypothetical protein
MTDNYEANKPEVNELEDLRKRVTAVEKLMVQVSAFNNPNSFWIKFNTYYMPLIMALAFTGILCFNVWNIYHMWSTRTALNKMTVWVMSSPLIVFATMSWIQFIFNPVTALSKLIGE